MCNDHSHLTIKFHGRIIDHLGIQMYQSPTAAIAELVANAWDADSDLVDITLPNELGPSAALIIRDTGGGMTFTECEQRYLNVGYNRRAANVTEVTGSGRPVLGRKGIGKFAGFGIARRLRLETTSGTTGERTIFELNLDTLRGNEYVVQGGRIEVIEYHGPDQTQIINKGTKITLMDLTLRRRIPENQFRISLARRFLLQEFAVGFQVKVNDQIIPTLAAQTNVEFDFPNAYIGEERPAGMRIADGWGVETVSEGRDISWRIMFLRTPIEDEELRGVSVFAGVKLAQMPFFFNLTGGLGGQHGQEYLTGQVKANYLDLLDSDIIATERQRVNWDDDEAKVLEVWGQTRLKELLRLWRDRRGSVRRIALEQRVGGFTLRLNALPVHERKTVTRALERIGSIPAISDDQFQDIGDGILLAWESGRLRDLIRAISEAEDINSDTFLSYLNEADVLTALNAAEVIRTKLEAIKALREMISRQELENAVRNHIAKKPYLIDPKWETFRVETSVRHFLDEASEQLQMAADDEGERKRIDLALRSGNQLLIVEFMRPGLRANWDHITRCERYLLRIRSKIAANTGLGLDPLKVSGLFVADQLEASDDMRQKIHSMESQNMLTYDWPSLLAEAEAKWSDFLFLVKQRAPDDQRVVNL